MSVEPNCDARQVKGRATVGVACTPLQVKAGLKFLVGGKWDSGPICHGDGRLPVEHGRLRAVVEIGDSVAGHGAGDQSAVVAPVEAKPRPTLPGCLVLHVRGHVKGFVVVDTENPRGAEGVAPAPEICGVKKRAATLDMTTSALKP